LNGKQRSMNKGKNRKRLSALGKVAFDHVNGNSYKYGCNAPLRRALKKTEEKPFEAICIYRRLCNWWKPANAAMKNKMVVAGISPLIIDRVCLRNKNFGKCIRSGLRRSIRRVSGSGRVHRRSVRPGRHTKGMVSRGV
jgi:hypothetical protein